MNENASIQVKDIMTTEALTLAKDTPIQDAIDILLKKRISGIPVCDESDKVIGIVTITTLFEILDKAFYNHPLENATDMLPQTIGEVMSDEVVCIAPDAQIKDVVHISLFRNIHTFPVVENDKIVGIIGRRDILKAGFSMIQ